MLKRKSISNSDENGSFVCYFFHYFGRCTNGLNEDSKSEEAKQQIKGQPKTHSRFHRASELKRVNGRDRHHHFKWIWRIEEIKNNSFEL